MLPDALQLRPGDDGGKRILHPHRVGVVLGIDAPKPASAVSNRHKKLRYSWGGVVGLEAAEGDSAETSR